MKLQRQQFLFNYLKALSGGLAWGSNPNLPHNIPALYQLSYLGWYNMLVLIGRETCYLRTNAQMTTVGVFFVLSIFWRHLCITGHVEKCKYAIPHSWAKIALNHISSQYKGMLNWQAVIVLLKKHTFCHFPLKHCCFLLLLLLLLLVFFFVFSGNHTFLHFRTKITHLGKSCTFLEKKIALFPIFSCPFPDALYL